MNLPKDPMELCKRLCESWKNNIIHTPSKAPTLDSINAANGLSMDLVNKFSISENMKFLQTILKQHQMKTNMGGNPNVKQPVKIEDTKPERYFSCDNSYPFHRGTSVCLANRRVVHIEDLRMEDFHAAWQSYCHSSLHSAAHRLCWARVTKIQRSEDEADSASSSEHRRAKITFTVHPGRRKFEKLGSVKASKSKQAPMIFNKKCIVTFEANESYAYFVFAESWASCSPRETFSRFGLICKQLCVGDDCMILLQQPQTIKEQPTVSVNPLIERMQKPYNGAGKSLLSGKRRKYQNTPENYKSETLDVPYEKKYRADKQHPNHVPFLIEYLR